MFGSMRGMLRDSAIIFLAAGQTLIWAGLYYIFPASLLRWELELGWSRTELTAALTLAVLISATASPLAGKIIDSGRGPQLMTACAIGGGIGLFILSTVTTLSAFFMVWATIGLCFAGCLFEPCFALVTRNQGLHAKRGIIVITLVAGFASTVSFPSMHILSEALGWRMATRLFGLMIIVLAAPLLWFGAHKLEKSTKLGFRKLSKDSGKHHDFLREPVFWYLGLGFAFSAIAHGAILHHLLPILTDRGFANELAVIVASFIGPMQVTGRLTMMVLIKRTSHHDLAMITFALMGLSIVLLLYSAKTTAYLFGFVILFGGAYGTTSILRPLIARDLLGEYNFGTKSGALALPYLAGAALSPYLGSIMWKWSGYNTMLSILVFVTMTGCILYVTAHRLSRSASSK